MVPSISKDEFLIRLAYRPSMVSRLYEATLQEGLTWNTAQVRVQFINAVVACIVKAQDNIPLYTMSVVDEQVRNGGSIRDEVGTNSLGRNLILAIRHDRRAIACDGRVALSEGQRQKGCDSSNSGTEHFSGLNSDIAGEV